MAFNERLAADIRLILRGRREIQEKRMFGGVGFLINGNMACGVHKDDLMLRLGEADAAAALKKPHFRQFDLTGKAPKGWVLVSAPGYAPKANPRSWIEKSLTFAGSLPAK